MEDIKSLDEFLYEYTPCEKLGKEFYLRAVETHNPNLMSAIVPAYEHNPKNLALDVYTPIQVHRHERYLNCGYHSHSTIEFMYMYKGQCLHNLEGETDILTEDEICIISPGVFHLPEIYDESILLNIIISSEALTHLCGEFDMLDGLSANLIDYFKQLQYGNKYPRYFKCGIKNDERLRQMFNELIREYYEYKKGCNPVMHCLLLSIICMIARSHNDESMVCEYTASKSNPLIPILQYINDNYSTVSLDTLAKRFSYSEQHICRLIKGNIGKTFVQHLTDIRLSKAKILLLTTDLSIADIARSCGYEENTYFHRLFKKVLGVTPIQYKKLYGTK